MMNNKNLALTGSLILLFSISVGALGAHKFSEILDEDRLKSFLTANQYLTVHGLAFLILAFFPKQIHKATQLIFIGLLLFSGSIFLLIALSHNAIEYPKIIGLITPVGGILLIAGWALLAFNIWKFKEN